MEGYSEHRKDMHGRADLENLRFVQYSNEVRIVGRESSKKQRGVYVSIGLSEDDVIELVTLFAGGDRLVRLRLKAALARLEYEAAVAESE